MSETVRFQEVRRTITKRGQCPVCGKRVQRSLTLSETVNPWNVNDDGTRKTFEDIIVSLSKKLHAWEPDFMHEKCVKGDSCE